MTALILTTGCGSSADVAAEVDGAKYTVEDLNDYLATTDPDNEARAPRERAAEWLSDWVFFSAVELELAEHGVEVSNDHEAQAVADITEADSAFVPGAAGGDVAIHMHAVLLAVLEWVEAEVPAVASPDPLRHLCSRHILVASPEEADEVLARLDAGEDFGLLAVELSQDAGSGSRGGALGCVVEGSLVETFEEAAYAAEPGEVVVAASEFGLHVIEVISSGPATAANHPQVDAEGLASMVEDADLTASERAQLTVQPQRQQMLLELQDTVIEKYASLVSVDDRYGHWDPEQFQVFPEPVS